MRTLTRSQGVCVTESTILRLFKLKGQREPYTAKPASSSPEAGSPLEGPRGRGGLGPGLPRGDPAQAPASVS